MDLSSDKILWVLEKFTKIAKSHLGAMAEYESKMKSEAEQLTDLAKKMCQDPHFCMFKKKFEIFKQIIANEQANTNIKIKDYSDSIIKPLTDQATRIKEIKNALYVSNSSYAEFDCISCKMKTARKEYFKRCKEFENIFIEHKILKDVALYDPSCRADDANHKHGMKRFHDKLVSFKEKYDRCMKEYNSKGKNLLMKNSLYTEEIIKFVMNSGIKIKESIEAWISKYTKSLELKPVAISSLAEMIDRIDPKLQFYGWAMAHSTTAPYPDFGVNHNSEDYSSFMANTMMMKKNTQIKEEFEGIIHKIQKEIFNDPDVYHKLVDKNPEKRYCKHDLPYPIDESSEAGPVIYGAAVSDKVQKRLGKYKISPKEYLNSLAMMAYSITIAWQGEKLCAKNLDIFTKRLENPIFGLSFPRLCQVLRQINVFEVSPTGYESIVQLFNIALVYSYKQRNVSIPLELINLAGTYYKVVKLGVFEEDSDDFEPKITKEGDRRLCKIGGFRVNCKELEAASNVGSIFSLNNEGSEPGESVLESPEPELAKKPKQEAKKKVLVRKKTQPQKEVKIYVLDGIRKHAIFRDTHFWEASLVYQVSNSIERFDFHQSSLSIEENVVNQNIKSQVVTTLMSIAFHMKDLKCSPDMAFKLMNKYIKKYKLPQTNRQMLLDFLDSAFYGDEKKKKNKAKNSTFFSKKKVKLVARKSGTMTGGDSGGWDGDGHLKMDSSPSRKKRVEVKADGSFGVVESDGTSGGRSQESTNGSDRRRSGMLMGAIRGLIGGIGNLRKV